MEESIDQLGGLLGSIVVEPPGPRCRLLAERLVRHESPTASGIKGGDIPVFWERARGANVVDVDGNIYVDLVGGFAAAAALSLSGERASLPPAIISVFIIIFLIYLSGDSRKRCPG